MNEPRAYYTEWSKSEREEQILYINAYIWNLEKWYQWTYLQGRNRDADRDNRLVGTAEEGEGGGNGQSGTETCRHRMWNRRPMGSRRITQGAQQGALWQPAGGGGGGGRRGWGGRLRRVGMRVCLWLIHVVVWQKPTQYCKAIILQLKINLKTHTHTHRSVVPRAHSPWPRSSWLHSQPSSSHFSKNYLQKDILTDIPNHLPGIRDRAPLRVWVSPSPPEIMAWLWS